MKRTGTISVFNTGAGDIALSFNTMNEQERADALKMLTDMQQRGYAILLQLDDGSYVRAVEVDASRGRYIIQLPSDLPVAAAGQGAAEDAAPKKRGRPKGSRRVSVPIETSRVTGVARSAGG